MALESFTAMVNVAGEVPVDGSSEDSRRCGPPERPARAAARGVVLRPMGHASAITVREQAPPSRCCPYYHEAVELIGRRWTGAIVAVLLDGGAMRFSQIAQAVPELTDRLLSERMKELEARGRRAPPRQTPGRRCASPTSSPPWAAASSPPSTSSAPGPAVAGRRRAAAV